jgi:hypothetical protein
MFSMIREVILNAPTEPPAPPVQNPNWPSPNNPFSPPYNPIWPYSDPLDFLKKIDPMLYNAVINSFLPWFIFWMASIVTSEELNSRAVGFSYVLMVADAVISFAIYKLFPFLCDYGDDMLISMFVGLFLFFYEMHVLSKWKQEKARKDFLREAKLERDEKP